MMLIFPANDDHEKISELYALSRDEIVTEQQKEKNELLSGSTFNMHIDNGILFDIAGTNKRIIFPTVSFPGISDVTRPSSRRSQQDLIVFAHNIYGQI